VSNRRSKTGRRANGQFARGVSGNPNGRPPTREVRADSAASSPNPRREIRADGYVNEYTGHGTSVDRRTVTTHVTRAVTDLEAADLRRGNWLAARIIEMPPTDAYRRGYDLKLGDKAISEKVHAALEDLCLNEKLVEAGQKEREAGGAALFPVLDGAVGDLSEPLEIVRGESSIGKVLALHLLEPRELVPISWYTTLADRKFRQPELYRFTPLLAGMGGAAEQLEIHESRLIIYPGLKFTAQQLYGQRLGWGDNVLTRVSEVISDFGLSWGSAASILHDFSQGVITLDQLDDILKEKDGEARLKRRLRAADMTRSALRAMVLAKGDTYNRSSSSVAGLAELLQQFMTLVAAAADMSVVRLFGISPAGMNATGQSDIELTDDRTIGKQAEYRRATEHAIRLVLNSSEGPTSGKEPDVWSLEWRPLRSPSEKERAETRKTIAETDKIYTDIDPTLVDSVVESRWKGDTFSAEMSVDWAEREKQKKFEKEQAETIAANAADLAALGHASSDDAANDDTEEPPPDEGAVDDPTTTKRRVA
jgi:phage-related protein (TIGR01555 family)